MYAREIDGSEHTFGVSGKFIMNALVMYDHQTRTLWNHFTGEDVQGPLAGLRLELVPVIHTEWSLWLELHQDTLVPDKLGRYAADAYADYYEGGSAGVLWESINDGRLGRKELVVGVRAHGQTKAYLCSS